MTNRNSHQNKVLATRATNTDLPHWAERFAHGSFKEKASLITRDGAFCGNAVYVRQEMKLGTMYHRIISDAGNTFLLTGRELTDHFYKAEYIMKDYLPTHKLTLQSLDYDGVPPQFKFSETLGNDPVAILKATVEWFSQPYSDDPNDLEETGAILTQARWAIQQLEVTDGRPYNADMAISNALKILSDPDYDNQDLRVAMQYWNQGSWDELLNFLEEGN